MSNEKLDVEGVAAKFGVPPERIVDYLALIGDSVDNIPGVEKVGPKTAAKWIAEHGSLEGVIAAAPTIKGVVGENLRKALDWLPQGARLVTVVTDCDLSGHVLGWPEFDALALREIEVEPLLAFYDRYGFASMRKELEVSLGRAPTEAAPAPRASARRSPVVRCSRRRAVRDIVKHYETVTTLEALDRWIARIEAAALTALDIETDSLDPIRARLIGLSLSVAPGEACYVPLGHSYAGAPDQLPLEAVLARLRPWLENAGAAKVGHNVKYDAPRVRRSPASRCAATRTTRCSRATSTRRTRRTRSRAWRFAISAAPRSPTKTCAARAPTRSRSRRSRSSRAADYSCEDADMALHVHQALWPRIEAERRPARRLPPDRDADLGGARRGSSAPAC